MAADGGSPGTAHAGAADAGVSAKAEPTIDFPKDLKKEEDKDFYVLGLSLGKGLSVFSMTKPEQELVRRGMTDGAAKPQKVTPQVLQPYGPKLQALAETRANALNKTYLDKAAKEKGAQKLPSGILYIPSKEGTGATPKPTDKVKVNYKGTLTDGTVFDSSYDRGTPAEFPVSGVIKCWTEGLQKMKVGGKAKLVCPSETAYGKRGQQPTIRPDSVLNFDVELLEASAAPPPAPPTPTPATPAPTPGK